MKERYATLKESFKGLPNYETLIGQFEISVADDEAFPLRKIANQMSDYVCTVKALIRPVIEPDTHSVMGMYEHSALSPEEIQGAFALYKQLCVMVRQLDVAKVDPSAKNQAQIIGCVFSQWQETRLQVLEFVKLLQHVWIEEEHKPSIGPSYLQ